MDEKRNIFGKHMPQNLDWRTIECMSRISASRNVIGLILIRHDIVEISTMPTNMAQVLACRLPLMNRAVLHALAEITATINSVNPIVDRIMDDDSVEGVVMTNNEGAPILTNLSAIRATNLGLALQRLGNLAQIYIKEMDPLDEVLVMRINTKKMEMIVAPHREFNIIVIQHATRKIIDVKK